MANETNEQKSARLNDTEASVSAAMTSSGGAGCEGTPFLGFVGSYTHGIDAKGRMIIPAAFREALGNKFAVSPTPDFKAVAIYSLPGWIERRDELVKLVKMNAKAQKLLDQFSKYSYTDCEVDAQGRLLLPQKLRAWRLGDAREVDVNGAVSHIRVLPAVTSREQDDNFDEEFADPLALIAEIQRGQQF
ncbi:MAG: hypothetical protein IJ189_03745 [Clostridia bacterium]|nr:hypothetical protein [Clostridia bacterium]